MIWTRISLDYSIASGLLAKFVAMVAVREFISHPVIKQVTVALMILNGFAMP